MRDPSLVALLALAGAAAGQAHDQHGPGGHVAPSPYAGWQDRPVKALSAEQTADLRAGRGMALALPAELNGYPGPMHALDLAGPLGLTPVQEGALREAVAQMRADAVRLGEQVIAAEAALYALFAESRATPSAVQAASRVAAAAWAQLRAAHMAAHIVTRDILTPEQVRHYAALRGHAPVLPSPPR